MTGQAVSVLGADEIARIQGPDVTRLLERLPGVTFSRNGGQGAFTGLRVRGADAEHLLVLVDGVRAADTAAPAGGFDFGTLLPAGVTRIELQRGANSTIWGSDALAGVMLVETLGREGISASAEYGGPDTIYAQAAARGAARGFEWGADGALLDSRGVSSAASGTEADGVRQWQAGGKVRAELTGGLALRAAVSHLDARLDLDGFPAPAYELADTAEYQDTRRSSGMAGIDYEEGDLSLRAAYALSDTQRDNYDPAIGDLPNYTTHGRDERADLRGRWDLAGDFRLYFGAERAWSRMETLFDAERRTASSGAYAQIGYRRDGLTLNAGLRRDSHRDFGGEWSFGADGAVELGSRLRLRASYGEAYKAPTLFQLHSDYGNAALRPARSHSYEIGLAYGDFDYGPRVEASLFRRDSTGLIDFISCFGTQDGICDGRPNGTYDNVGHALAQGFELEGRVEPLPNLRLEALYSYVEAVNDTPGAANEGRALARRPRHSATMTAEWRAPLARMVLGADLRVVSASYDDAANLVRLPGYAVLTLRGSVPLSDELELFGRVENLWDETYQTAAGYSSPGRGAYLGARARF